MCKHVHVHDAGVVHGVVKHLIELLQLIFRPGTILGERVVLGLRDDDKLLEYVSRGREARQRQRLATADQAMEREKRVALAHRQACTLPTYPANLPRLRASVSAQLTQQLPSSSRPRFKAPPSPPSLPHSLDSSFTRKGMEL